MGSGSYLHFGLKHCIEKFLNESEMEHINSVKIDIGIDGVPMSKSSWSQLWPILGNVVGQKEVFVIGAYHGCKKPFCADVFLENFVEENGVWHSNPFVNKSKISMTNFISFLVTIDA